MSWSEPPDSIDDSIEAPDAMRSAKRVLVVGGGRGGVGKSLLAGSLAVYFAQLGKSVVLVDADPTGGNLHTQFGLTASAEDPESESHEDFTRALVPTNVPGLVLLPAAHDSIVAPMSLRAARKGRWLARLRALNADYVVIDVGPGHGHFALDVMLSADIPICVTVPEPPAIETTYRFLRAAYRRRLRRAVMNDRYRLAALERALHEIGTLPAPIDLVRAFQKMDTALAELAWAEANRMRMHLVVNQTRVRTDVELGNWMSGLVQRHYGVHLDELGHIEHDDTVWTTVRKSKPLLVESPTCKAARNVERIARRVLALTAARHVEAPPTPIPPAVPTLYTVLGIARSANDEEMRRAYKRQREIYANDGLATASLLTDAQRKTEQTRFDEAHDTLLDAMRRRAYDLSTFATHEEPETHREERPALAAEQLMLQNQLAHEVGPDTDFTGALLKKAREAYGIELTEISSRTKIARVHLQAIEDETFDVLPAIVYVRGFVAELAKFLKLDPMQVQKTYLRRMRSSLGLSEHAGSEPPPPLGSRTSRPPPSNSGTR